MKKIFIFILAFSLILSACTKPDEVITGNEANGVISVEYASGKVLGTPQSDESVDFGLSENVDLDFRLNVPPYQDLGNVTSFTVVKRLIQGETVTDWVEIETVTEMPYSLVYTTVSEFIEGLGVAVNDLRIGDVFEFTAKITGADGSVQWPSSTYGVLSITVNCFSDLEGFYDMVCTRDDGAYVDRPGEFIEEISPGYYKTMTTGTWAAGSIAPDQGFNFSDVCNTITVPAQDLAQGYYSNDVNQDGDAGTSFVNPDTGVITIKYSIDFSSGARTYTNVYTPVVLKKAASYTKYEEVENHPDFIDCDIIK